MRGHIDTIERVTGWRPPTCPWRAFSEPIVREVLALAAFKDGDLVAAIGTNAPADLIAAIGVYRRARNATDADEQALLRIERDAKRRAVEAARKK